MIAAITAVTEGFKEPRIEHGINTDFTKDLANLYFVRGFIRVSSVAKSFCSRRKHFDPDISIAFFTKTGVH
jgi:hypothetical protein